MAAFGELKPHLNEIARLLRILVSNTCNASTPSPAITSAGTGQIPSGYKSIAIVATAVPSTITLSDGSTYTFTVVGETFIQSASVGGTLPAYSIAGGTWKWQGVK